MLILAVAGLVGKAQAGLLEEGDVSGSARSASMSQLKKAGTPAARSSPTTRARPSRSVAASTGARSARKGAVPLAFRASTFIHEEKRAPILCASLCVSPLCLAFSFV